MGGKFSNFLRAIVGKPTLERTMECRVKIENFAYCNQYKGIVHKDSAVDSNNVSEKSQLIKLSDDFCLEIQNAPEMSSKEINNLLMNKEIVISRKYIDSNGKIIWGRWYPI